jgi:hypothetical protein
MADLEGFEVRVKCLYTLILLTGLQVADAAEKSGNSEVLPYVVLLVGERTLSKPCWRKCKSKGSLLNGKLRQRLPVGSGDDDARVVVLFDAQSDDFLGRWQKLISSMANQIQKNSVRLVFYIRLTRTCW